ncbi:3'5'-cyclic nucleotide phosphodiesterase domain-containing protein [Cardiosporidium cionae]|uniref:3'5'-cyclic nucleotide phosphodiesterase domain-containing protein n=1 Tax=Cardiosporidium cionae TaxID=476202 RepID=A0ABQ7JC59_9APIC|nr:3'5'-cyclic nucleotide phosphodiesterase domain-containing protein [Cardiosporidium cionae]|eukprot:KAF8821245.1 3'5'-cyclic nucleotide phosphodiesterase domain-containing protein [Cardiosporidium cionae]
MSYLCGTFLLLLINILVSIFSRIVPSQFAASKATAGLRLMISMLLIAPIPFIALRWFLGIWIIKLCCTYSLIEIIWPYSDLIDTGEYSKTVSHLVFIASSIILAGTIYEKEKESRHNFYNRCRIRQIERRKTNGSMHDNTEKLEEIENNLPIEKQKVTQIIEAMMGVQQQGLNVAPRSLTWRADIANMRELYQGAGELDENINCKLSATRNIGTEIYEMVAETSGELKLADFRDVPAAGSVSAKGPEEGSVFPQNRTAIIDWTLPLSEYKSSVYSRCGKDWNLNIIALEDDWELGCNILFHIGVALTMPLVVPNEYISNWPNDLHKQVMEAAMVPVAGETLFSFLRILQESYLKNPYHNQSHAAEVAHLAVCLASMQNIRYERRRGFTFLEGATTLELTGAMGEFAFIIAALAHDTGHPGLTNLFLINNASPLAIVYNDKSILENFHAAKIFQIASSNETAIFKLFSDKQYREARKRIIELILATDMAKHFDEIAELHARMDSSDFDHLHNAADGWLIAKLCIKAADLGHGALEWAQHRIWSERVLDEFYKQGEEEARCGFKTSPLCERQPLKITAESQHGFLFYVVTPLYTELAEVCPSSAISDVCIEQIKENCRKWKDVSN